MREDLRLLGQYFLAFVAAVEVGVGLWMWSMGEHGWGAADLGIATLLTLELLIDLGHTRKEGR